MFSDDGLSFVFDMIQQSRMSAELKSMGIYHDVTVRERRLGNILLQIHPICVSI